MFPDGRRAVRAEVKKYQDQFRSPRKRGVYYFVPARGIDALRCAMDSQREGASCRKRIVVRPSRFRKGLHELYTYHFPKHWSAACVANREMIKEAQRQAHALEKDFSLEAMEWRIRFFNHYFRVFKGGERPEPVSFEPIEPEQPFRLKKHIINTGMPTFSDLVTKPGIDRWQASLPPPI